MNKKTIFLLGLIILHLKNPLQGILGTINILRSLPLITAFIRRTFFKSSSTSLAGHIIYNTDGSLVTEHQFNNIKETILRPNEFPTALKNPNYNPDKDAYFKRQDPRFILYEAKDEAFNAYKQLKEYQIQHATGVTEYTKDMINKARESFKKGRTELEMEQKQAKD